jgi:hypothetical protein
MKFWKLTLIRPSGRKAEYQLCRDRYIKLVLITESHKIEILSFHQKMELREMDNVQMKFFGNNTWIDMNIVICRCAVDGVWIGE